MPTPRPLPWILAAVAAGALLWLVFGQRASEPSAERPHAGHEPASPQAPASPPPALPTTPEPGAHPAAAHHDHEDPGAAPGAGEVTDPEVMSMLPEPPGPDDIGERPARQPLTPEEQREQNERALALIDRSIERLEAERKAAEASGDTRTAERNRIRIERLRQRRVQLTQPLPGTTP